MQDCLFLCSSFLLFSLRPLKPLHHCKAQPRPAKPTTFRLRVVLGLCHSLWYSSSPLWLFAVRRMWVHCAPRSCPAPPDTHTWLPAPWVLLWLWSLAVPLAGKRDWVRCPDWSPLALPAKGRQKRRSPGAGLLSQPRLLVLWVRAKVQRS